MHQGVFRIKFNGYHQKTRQYQGLLFRHSKKGKIIIKARPILKQIQTKEKKTK